jgi:hypothetical protein
MNQSKKSLAVAAALALAVSCGAAWAQESGVRVYEEELRVKLDEQSVEPRNTGIDGGGWLDFALFRFDDDQARRVRTLRQYTARAWASANLDGVHQAYVRGLFDWDDWNTGDNVNNTPQNFQVVERAWYEFSLGQLLMNQTGKPSPMDFRIKVGREYATIGTGLVLAMPLDLVQTDLTFPGWELTTLLGKTVTDTPNIDDSQAVEDHQQRAFYGGQVTYTGLTHHRPFAYFLGQDDHTTPEPKNPLQAYEYSSRYVGIGSTGNVAVPELLYQTELVWESGHEFSYHATENDGTDSICALGFDGQLQYSWRAPTHPQFMMEYLRGSGDSDRLTSATSTVGGNRLGTIDHAFNAFGFRDTGVAFAPDIANLNIYVVGANFHPLEQYKPFKKLQVGTKAFFYQKSVADGPLSDTTATNHSPWVGWEWDAFCDWRITSDLTWTLRYGAFEPGDAFLSGFDDCRQLVYTGVSFSF